LFFAVILKPAFPPGVKLYYGLPFESHGKSSNIYRGNEVEVIFSAFKIFMTKKSPLDYQFPWLAKHLKLSSHPLLGCKQLKRFRQHYMFCLFVVIVSLSVEADVSFKLLSRMIVVRILRLAFA
jgi:hypothetical protein